MKKSILFILAFVILLSSVLTVMASAENSDYADDMFDDDVNITYDAGTTATTAGSILGALGNIGNNAGDGVGDFVGGVVESVFQDNDVSQQVGDKVNGVVGIFDKFDLDGLIPTTQKSTVGSNFFDTIDPVVTGSFNSNLPQTPTTTIATALNGESVDYNTTVNPYTKPTTALNPGDKSDGVKWLQWILIYTECGLQGTITGEYDDATAAAVKTLQLKYNMTVDGIASLEVIEKAEQMYNEYINGVTPQGSTNQAVFNTIGATNPVSQGGKADKGVNAKVTAIIVVLIIVWIFAIAAVFIIVHIKRKNITLSEDGEIVKPEKEKKEKSKKKKNASKRSSGTLREYEPLRESKTLQSLEDDAEDVEETSYDSDNFDASTFDESSEFEVLDFDEEDYEDGELKLSSLSEVKEKRAESTLKSE